MTNEEAIMLLNPSTRILALAEIEYYNGFRGKDAYIKAIEDAHILAVEALEKADKYRWHDLRKNPDDLPEAIGGGYESEYVLVMIGLSNIIASLFFILHHLPPYTNFSTVPKPY